MNCGLHKAHQIKVAKLRINGVLLHEKTAREIMTGFHFSCWGKFFNIMDRADVNSNFQVRNDL